LVFPRGGGNMGVNQGWDAITPAGPVELNFKLKG